MNYERQIEEIIDYARFQLSDIKPSEWAEKNRVLIEDTPFPGPFSFKHTPYCREIVDCFMPDHPAQVVAVMKGAQIGISTNVLENAIGWIISEEPGNIMFLSGHIDLTEEAMNTKIDKMIDSCGLRHLIKPNVRKVRNQRTGDTSRGKEFPGGSLVAGAASNHKLLRQRSIRYALIDDFDAAKKSSKAAGSTIKLIKQRLAAYGEKRKEFYFSSPEEEENSNIEPAYMAGDQRKYFVPCPCCGVMIPLEWEVEMKNTDNKEKKGGITWQLDDSGKLITDSVGYNCQECGDFFTDAHKYEMNLQGEWRPTAEPSRPGYYSYHISCLYAPMGMYDWEYYVREWIEANPVGQPPKEIEVQSFMNLNLGLTYKKTGKSIEANSIQKKVRDYEIGRVPDLMSQKDGCGQIVMLTCACDLNGKEHDARLDFEIVAWAENASSYSVRHGSIGTFIPHERTEEKVDRAKWSYEYGQPNCVWPELDKILSENYLTDTNRAMSVLLTGIDCGYYTNHAYGYIDRTNVRNVVGVRGDKEEELRKVGADLPDFKPARERRHLYMLDVNNIKDKIARNIELRWQPGTPEAQPTGFMNFPTPSGGLYTFNNYFSHFESEHRIVEVKDSGMAGSRWVKKKSGGQNHHWDCYVYNYALKEIWAHLTLQAATPKLKGNWFDFVNYMKIRKLI